MQLPCEYKKSKYPIFKQFINGGYHTGYDIKAIEGTLCRSVIDATTIYVNDQVFGYGALRPSKMGWCIWLQCIGKDKLPYVIQYGHMASDLKVGDKVSAGSIIGVIAPFKNGINSQPHLHFAVRTGARLPLGMWGYVESAEQLDLWREPMKWLKENT